MRHPIAAGVGGAGGWQALAWAAELAAHTGERLVLLQVCAPGSPLDRFAGDPAPAEVEVVEPALARAYATVGARLGRERTTLKICTGPPSDRLVDASEGVRLLVIGDGGGGRTIRQVVQRAHCPVVVVHPGNGTAGSLYAGYVVAGVDASTASRGALEMAFGYAEQNHLPLAAIHVSERPPGDDAQLLTDAVRPWKRIHPGVRTRCSVITGSVDDALIRSAAGARLLVVGDKRRGAGDRARIGDVPLTLATAAPCPVAVVPLAQHHTEPL
ncbi:universal stress protein [Paractinoplanes durhamensis]|uniref:Universal stress protein n=1 Tax=Paractinoplanes durhamensis TaxID=113563 RepID=A0ABQ3YRK3_9ACTN|nr:universal stress protein [Actinoplanes durhamensis]GIE00207.1 universal stress protein [Actinoplanes durhamensis]